VRVGVGLWTLQSTQAAPSNLARAYLRVPEDARRVEALGYDSLWLAEHRFWYDGWCPQPLVVVAAAAASTERLRFGTAMLLLAQHEPARFARLAVTTAELSGGRLELGVGLGHRDAEFDGLGLRRDRRGARMTEALDVLLASDGCPPVWIGGMAPAALERGATRGTGFVLPQTLYPSEIAEHVATIRGHAAAAGVEPGPIGMVKDCWVVGGAGGPAADEIRERFRWHYREEAGSWWVLKGDSTGFQRPELLDRQLQRVYDTALIGVPDDVIASLNELRDAGVDLVTLRFWFDVTAGDEAWESMALLAAEALDDEGALR
jgi:alkanesulfonate monooxygenase SsuD/methylene tetrahydromethanopterin reductase-like flavin-dependent oxidoreductase (luciferase family)